MPLNNAPPSRCAERGNAFFIILLGVVLFAALMFTFSRSGRQGGENISKKTIDLAVVDVIEYAQKLERAAGRVMLGGRFSESQISFDNGTDYANANCTADQCKVFHPSGGGASWRAPPPDISGSNWIINGKNRIPDIGDDAAADLTILLPGLSLEVCRKINDKLGVTNPSGAPPVDADGINTDLFDGAFANSAVIGAAANLSRTHAACFKNGADYVFYSVLYER